MVDGLLSVRFAPVHVPVRFGTRHDVRHVSILLRQVLERSFPSKQIPDHLLPAITFISLGPGPGPGPGPGYVCVCGINSPPGILAFATS